MLRLRRSPDEARPLRSGSGRIGLRLAIALLCIVISGAILGDAGAAETKIRTLSLAPLPEATTIEIRLPVEDGSDDLRLAVTLADHFSALLTELGYTMVEGDGELVFRFAAEEPTYAQKGDRSRHASPAAGKTRADGYRAELYPVAFASLVALSKSDQDTYRLRVSVARARKPPLWTGFIERSVRGAERQATYLSMADALLALWGRTFFDSD